MRILAFSLGLLTLSLAPLSAQVTVEVVQDQDQFLPGESLHTAVRITNRSGQPLRLGTDNDWLSFAIESRDTGSVTSLPRLGDIPVKGEFTLESSQIATKRVDLAPYFALTRSGRYNLIATVHIKEWDRDVTSEPKTFYIIEGTKLWEQYFGVPTPAGATNTAPEVRRYVLQEANYLKGELRLYLRLTDASGEKPLRVVAVGPLVSVSRPQPLLDRFSNLHLLYQNGARSFSYTTFDPDGKLLLRQTYDYLGARPRLHTDENGIISVQGGVRRFTARDVPKSSDDLDAADAGPTPTLPPVMPPKPAEPTEKP